MITTEMMKLTPYAVSVERRSQLKSFTDTDFIRLKNDPTVNLVYSSNEFGGVEHCYIEGGKLLS